MTVYFVLSFVDESNIHLFSSHNYNILAVRVVQINKNGTTCSGYVNKLN